MSTRLKLKAIFFLVFLLPGVAVVGYALDLAVNAMKLTRSGLHQTGTLVKYERPKNQGKKAKIGSSLCSVVQFSYGDKTHEFTDEWCSQSPEDFPPGAVMPVVFDPASPEKARLDMFWVLYGPSLLPFIIGAPWLLIGLALLIRTPRV